MSDTTTAADVVLPFVVFNVAFVFACRSIVLTDAARLIVTAASIASSLRLS